MLFFANYHFQCIRNIVHLNNSGFVISVKVIPLFIQISLTLNMLFFVGLTKC